MSHALAHCDLSSAPASHAVGACASAKTITTKTTTRG